jgi:hypothetical protein
VVGAGTTQVAHSGEQHAAVHVGPRQVGLEFERVTVMCQRALEVMRRVYAQPEREVVGGLGQRLVEREHLLEWPRAAQRLLREQVSDPLALSVQSRFRRAHPRGSHQRCASTCLT